MGWAGKCKRRRCRPSSPKFRWARWALRPLEEAKHSISFVTDPTWRAYVINYTAGRDLCRRYVNGDASRFRTLLTEQVRIGELLSA